VLEIRGLSRKFGNVQAVRDVSFVAPNGTVVGFLGPNGAGKSTTMRSIMGVIEPDAGVIAVDGETINAKHRERFGYMPEERGLYPRMQLRDQLVYLARLYGLGRGWARSNADHWLERLGLTDRAAAPVGELSHGNQQRAQLAAALVHDPDVLILDEPFSGLDPVAVKTLAAILAERAAGGATVLFSSHQLDLVEDICRTVVVLSHGSVVMHGEVNALRRAAPHWTARIAVVGNDGSWTDDLRGAQLLDRHDDVVRLRVERDVDLDSLLDRARARGEVAEFSFQPPRLSELFLEAVS
jgi:ABC-2 type transport system ATP-binding protein